MQAGGQKLSCGLMDNMRSKTWSPSYLYMWQFMVFWLILAKQYITACETKLWQSHNTLNK